MHMALRRVGVVAAMQSLGEGQRLQARVERFGVFAIPPQAVHPLDERLGSLACRKRREADGNRSRAETHEPPTHDKKQPCSHSSAHGRHQQHSSSGLSRTIVGTNVILMPASWSVCSR